jgi:glycosyltransferase involved in cell wall biosynthesis
LPLGAALNRLLARPVWRAIERFAGAGRLVIGVGRPSATALAAVRELDAESCFFDAMDNFPEFHRGLSRRAMRHYEDAIAAEVDLVLASSTYLAEKFARRGLRVEKILNGCNANAECGMRNDQRDRDTGVHSSSLITHPSPVLGYLGCVGHWFDWPLVIRLAQGLPGAAIELVGPCLAPRPKRLPPNVRCLPACDGAEAAGHLRRFSAGLIPFQRNELTAGVDPIKFYEYRAAGLPVLSTTFGEMASRGREEGVYFLDQTDDLASLVSEALADGMDASRRRCFRRENEWSCRFRQSQGMRRLWGLRSTGFRPVAGGTVCKVGQANRDSGGASVAAARLAGPQSTEPRSIGLRSPIESLRDLDPPDGEHCQDGLAACRAA